MSDPELTITAVREPTSEHVEALKQLLPQLSSAPPPDLEALRRLASHPGTTLLFARLSDRLVGTLTLETFTIPSGVRAWIEDVIVDESARGAGVGTALVRRALEEATASGARTVDLTSRPSRVAANELYKRVGFVARETNVYRCSLK
jgi:ribosomal protein S18 acetylase RimI-like enzyme